LWHLINKVYNNIDNLLITVIFNLVRLNYKKLKEIALELIFKAKEVIISFNTSKTKFIYFYNKYITIKEGLKLGDMEISPKPLVR